MVLLHGAGGFLDELVIVAIAFGVLWLAVRLSGRPSATQAADAEAAEAGTERDPQPPVAPP